MLYTILWYIIRNLLDDESTMAGDFLAAFYHMRFAPGTHQKALFVGFLNRRGYQLRKMDLTEEECKVAFRVDGLDVVIFVDSDHKVDCIMVDHAGNIVYSDITSI